MDVDKKIAIDPQLIDAIRTGKTIAIEEGMKSLQESTKEGFKEALSLHLSKALEALYVSSAYEVDQGSKSPIESGAQRIADMFLLAQANGISLSCALEVGGSSITITSSDQALAFLRDVINSHLSKGIQGLVSSLADEVKTGVLEELVNYENKIEEWLALMKARGFIVIDDMTRISQDGNVLVGPQQVNTAVIRMLVEKAIKDNLKIGCDYIVSQIAQNVRMGISNPLQKIGTSQNVSLYVDAAEKYGLLKKDVLASDPNAPLYINPDVLKQGLLHAVEDNLLQGFIAIREAYLKSIAIGDASVVQYREEVFEEYVRLVEEYKAPLDINQMKESMKACLGFENLQKGIKACIQAIEDSLARSNHLQMRIQVNKAEKFKAFIAQKGLEAKIDFSELSGYIAESKAQLPGVS